MSNDKESSLRFNRMPAAVERTEIGVASTTCNSETHSALNVYHTFCLESYEVITTNGSPCGCNEKVFDCRDATLSESQPLLVTRSSVS